MRVILLSGKAGSGKDTVGEILSVKHGFRPWAFAEKLKIVVQELFGLGYCQVHGTREEKEAIDPRYGKSGRQILIELGQFCRTINPNIWEDITLKKIGQYFYGYSGHVITDLRLKSEANRARQWGKDKGLEVILVRIERPGISTINTFTETDLDDYDGFDYYIHNDGSLEDLERKVDELMRGIKGA